MTLSDALAAYTRGCTKDGTFCGNDIAWCNEHLPALIEAARKFAALEPMLLILTNLRDEGTQGEWVYHEARSSDYITTIECDGSGVAYATCGYNVDQQNADADFIATAANLTTRISGVIRGREHEPN